MQTFTSLRIYLPSVVTATMAVFSFSFLHAQVVRSYTNIYSDNIRGGHTIIGNTSTAIYSSGSGSTGTINLAQMNDFSTSGTGNYTYGRTSAYGNDNSNIQLVDVDGGNDTTSLLSYGGLWRYYSLNNYSAAPPDIAGLNWRADAYNDATNWTNTPDNTNAFGYNEPGVNSPVQTNRETYYLRRDMNIVNPSKFSFITLTTRYDDGALVFVNGTEVARINMPSGTPVYGTNPSSNREYGDGDFVLNIPASDFLDGNNQIAVELYQGTSTTVDFYFDMKLDGVIADVTTNSSSANLNLPAGSNSVKFARLYWGGRIDAGMGGADNINLRTVKIRFNAENYQTINAAPGAIDKSVVYGTDSVYQAYFDVTTYVNNRKNGTYSLADITASTGSTSNGGNFAGWALVVVYENLSLPYSSIRVYDGYLQVYDGGAVITRTITLNGLNPPANFSDSSDAYMSTMAWEGDANLAADIDHPEGDYIKVNGTAASNAVNPVSNIWNGTISRNGAHLSGNKNPDFKNQMSIDIDELQVGIGFGISPATTDVNIEFGTEADQYFPSIFAFTMKTKPPLVQLDKIVKDTASGNAPWQIPNNLLNPNEILTYTITGKNLGDGHALNCVITDTVPHGLTYRAGSLKVNAPTPGVTAGFQTDASGDDAAFQSKFGNNDYIKFFIGNGATPTSGGILSPNDSFSVQFQCIVPSNASTLNFVTNTARITGTEQDGITPFVDDGSATIGPMGIGLPVNMTEFTVQKQNNDALLRWTTGSEIKNEHFDIERSDEGINFIRIGSVNGNGTTTAFNNYQYIDPISSSSMILYYRLKVVDIDHKGFYSKIVVLRLAGSETLNNLTVYPNPFTSNIKLQFNSSRETFIRIHIKNAAGQQEANYNIPVQRGGNIIVLSNLETLMPGIHFMEIISEDGKFVQKIMKQ